MQLVKAHADGVTCVSTHQARALGKSEGISDAAKIAGILRIDQSRAFWSYGALVNRLEQADLMPQPAQPENILQHRPGPSALPRDRRDSRRDENRKTAAHRASSSGRAFAEGSGTSSCCRSSPSTRSESKYRSAIRRAARQCCG